MIPGHHVRAIAEALEETGSDPRDIRLLKARPARMAIRASYRVDLVSGCTVKARIMVSDVAARRQQELRAGLPDAFARVLGRAGAVLIEEWIDGRALTDAFPAEAFVREAGRLLAALHATPPPSVADEAPARCWVDSTREDLQRLKAAGVLEAAIVDRLDAAVAAEPPGAEPRGLTHHDFCGENMVVTPEGRLHVVDNEHTAIDAAGLDLARSWYRWGLRGTRWDWFRDAYLAGGGSGRAFAHERVWRIVGATASAGLRLRDGWAGLDVPLACLRRLAVSQDGETAA